MRNFFLVIAFLFCIYSHAQNIEQKSKDKIGELSAATNDSISLLKQTPKDSLTKNTFQFNLLQLIIGYKHQRPHKNETYKYNGLLSTFSFNAVQGFNVTTGLSYLKEKPQTHTFYEIGGLVNYGVAENKPRFSGYYTQLFNHKKHSKLTLSGGLTVHQFGEDFPIKNLINAISSSYFGKNFAKFYQKDYISIKYQQDVLNGLFGSVELEYAHRRPLFNHTKHSPFVKNKSFSSNNPIAPSDFENPGFEQNQIVKLKFKTVIDLNQKQNGDPNKDKKLPKAKYPLIYVNFETGFHASLPKYNYSLLGVSTSYTGILSKYGTFGAFFNGGLFLNADHLAFMDYKHFYGNETFLGTTQNYLQNFNLLPYYAYSTNRNFIELHAEHNFNGFIANKIPLFNKLKWHFVVGGHALYTHENKAYYEIGAGLDNIGFRNFRPFRVDFFQSFNGTRQTNGIVISVKLLDKMK